MNGPAYKLDPTSFEPGTRFWAVVAAFRRRGWRVYWHNFQLLAVRLH